MGYLDGTSVTVDAILTKKGREIMSRGGAIDVRSFTLTDTGVDYTIWNPDHPSGSAYYGEAIENTPQTEALPLAQYTLRNKLVSFSRDTVAMPAVTLSYETHTFFTKDPIRQNCQILGWSGLTAKGGGGWTAFVPDTNILSIGGSTGQPIGGAAMYFISEAEIPNAAVYNIGGAGSDASFKIMPATNLDAARTCTVIFFHNPSGAYNSALFTVNALKDTRVRIPSSSVKK